MALTALIFDLDGTLVDTTSVHARAWERALAEFGYRVPAERIALEVGKGGDRLVPALLGPQAEAAHGAALRAAHGELYLEVIHAEGVRPFPRVPALLEALRARGMKVAVATAAGEEHLAATLRQAGLDGLREQADALVTDRDVDHSKPHPEAVRPAVEKLGVPAVQCAMVGDTTYDVEAGKRAGLVTLGVIGGPHAAAALRRAGARAVYADAAALLAHLDEALALASPGTGVLTEDHLDALMAAALDEARAGLDRGEVPIGSVLARSDGTLVARGRNENRRLGSRVAHAEMQALHHAAGKVPRDARDLLLVTTLEPCVMCLGAAMNARVDTVVYALPAPSNGGIDRCAPHASPGAFLPRFVGGVRAAESRALLEAWLRDHPHARFVRDLLEQLGENEAQAE